MAPRLEFQSILEGISDNVYFQPPANFQMTYPCIVYNVDLRKTLFAGNKPYNNRKRYQVTVMDRNPDGEISEKIAALPMCTFNRHFAADQVNHDVYHIFF